MWLWWLAAKITGASMALEMLAALDADPREDARERQNPGRQADAPNGARRPAAVPRGKVHRLGGRRARGRLPLDERAQLGQVLALRRTRPRRCASETRPRARPSARPARASSGRARRASSPGARSPRPACFATSAASLSVPVRDEARRAAALHPVANRRALQLARAFGSRQLRLRPDQRRGGSSDDRRAARWPPARWRPDRRRDRGRARRGPVHCAARAPARPCPADAPTTAESRTPGSWFRTRSTSSGKTFSPSGVTIISFLRPRMKSCPSSPISPMSPV